MEFLKNTMKNMIDAYGKAQEINRTYARHTDGNQCPYCFSNDISLKRYVDIDDMGSDLEVYECANCGSSSYF